LAPRDHWGANRADVRRPELLTPCRKLERASNLPLVDTVGNRVVVNQKPGVHRPSSRLKVVARFDLQFSPFDLQLAQFTLELLDLEKNIAGSGAC
jgi:hypothetical protein